MVITIVCGTIIASSILAKLPKYDTYKLLWVKLEVTGSNPVFFTINREISSAGRAQVFFVS